MQMTASPRMKNAMLSKVLPKTINPLKKISTTRDTVAVDGRAIQNSLFVEREPVAISNEQSKDETEQTSDLAVPEAAQTYEACDDSTTCKT